MAHGGQINIRLLGPEEIEAFRQIRLEALQTEPAAYASTAADWESLTHDEWHHRLTNNAVFVAFHREKPVGMMGLMRQQSSKMAHRATIIMVYVHKSFRGLGAASALLERLTGHAREVGIRQLELAVSAQNPPAIRFYEREGFSQVGRIPGGIIHDGEEIDDVVMARRIVD
ncbi:N-acetyltransferase family protein [Rhizobium yanglingense]